MLAKIVAVIGNSLSAGVRCVCNRNNNRQTEKQWPQIIALLIGTKEIYPMSTLGSLPSLSMGTLMSWPSPSIPIIISPDFPGDITMEQASYLTVLPSILMVIASPIFAKFPDQIGRKPCLLIFTAGPQIAAWGLIAGTTSIEWLYLSRALSGIANGCVFTVLPMYIGEMATPKVRGTWGNVMTIAYILGQLIVNAVGAFYSIRVTALSLVTIPILFLSISYFVPESPYYLIMKGEDEKAKNSLRWLRSGTTNSNVSLEFVDQEFQQMYADVQRQLSESGRFKELLTISSNRRALVICIFARVCQQYTGITGFNMYLITLFNEAGGNVDATTSTLVYTGVQLTLCCMSAAVTDKIGRKKAMVISSLSCGICLASLSIFLFLKNHSTVSLSAVSWFPIAGMLAFIIGASIGLTNVATILTSELFSTSVKPKALFISTITFGLCIASTTKIMQVLMSKYGLFAPFAFFAVITLVNSVLAYFIIPNTTGKTLEEIQQYLKKEQR